MYIDDREEPHTNNDNRLNQSPPQNPENQVNFDLLISEQKDRLFQEYAWQQQREELARLNEKGRAKFEQLVSQKELEKLIQMRADRLKEEYGKQRLAEENVRLNQPSTNQTSLTQEYLDFKKRESTEKEAEIKRAERGFLGTKPPDSPHDFKSWYYAGKASEEFQINCGIIPPQNITPSGAVWYYQLVADGKRLEVEKLVEVEKEHLKETGFSPEQIQKRENAIYKQAFSKVGEQWKQERAEALKAWQESKGLKSFQNFNIQQESQQPQNKEQVEVKVADLEKWRQEAQGLGRSEKHLEKIDQIINSVKQKTNAPVSSVEISARDFKAMQRDRNEFKQESQLNQENKQPVQTETHTRGIRR